MLAPAQPVFGFHHVMEELQFKRIGNVIARIAKRHNIMLGICLHNVSHVAQA
jgi:hypothetical protein